MKKLEVVEKKNGKFIMPIGMSVELSNQLTHIEIERQSYFGASDKPCKDSMFEVTLKFECLESEMTPEVMNMIGGGSKWLFGE